MSTTFAPSTKTEDRPSEQFGWLEAKIGFDVASDAVDQQPVASRANHGSERRA
jgi:hypothetical protein